MHPRKYRLEPHAILPAFWRTTTQEPQVAFLNWLTSFGDEFNRAFHPSAASGVGRLIEKEHRRRWTLSELADRFHATPSQLRRGFWQEFGMSVRHYQRLHRLLTALNLLREYKVDAVAHEVGYRSKKDFYQAFEGVIGMTPNQFRHLPNEETARLIDRLHGRPG